ncbi:hypothetical protein [Pengzhenrongella phosphoraccumulans]|uniref:hypothetical protein n=1 Tax=Pengzhenrongella phosphoraccumulans TaxID=3114394 RepID=UPI00388E3556
MPEPPPPLASAGDLARLVLARDVEPAALRDDVLAGRLRRTRRGAYHPVEPSAGAAIDRQREARRRIAALAAQLTTPMWFSHESAALIWDLAVVRLSGRTDLTQLYPQNGRTDRDVRRHCAALPTADRTRRGGLPVTSLERTVLDCAMALPLDRGLVIADSALHGGLDLDRLVDRLGPLTGHRGVRRARTVLALTDARAESPGETLVRFVVVQAGLPRPELQIEVPTATGTYRIDLGWTERKLGIEFDGFVKYSSRDGGTAAETVFAEKRRQDALEEAGWKILRITWSDLTDPEHLTARIRRHLTSRHHTARELGGFL